MSELDFLPRGSVPIWQVDAFTDRPLTGNPAAVCILPRSGEADWMQRVAAEMALSETAFLVRLEGSSPETVAFDLRWFTPVKEVDLCGHATLASAHVLWESGAVPAGMPIRFLTASGELGARPASGRWIELDFPAEPVQPWTEQPAEEVAAALHAPRERLLRVTANRLDLLVELPDETAVRELTPDMAKIAALSCRGVIVTSASSEAASEDRRHDPGRDRGYDFVSRYFAPQFGVSEDPVTGSAHCALAPFWIDRLGREPLVGYQASARGGHVRVHRSEDGTRIRLGGQAVTVLRGELVARTMRA